MRIEQLTFTRFVAAIAIVIYHFGTKVYPFNHPFVTAIFQYSFVGVSFFYILSGFVMIVAYHKYVQKGINIRQYLKNRLARVYPVYLIALILIIIIYTIDKRIFTHTEIGLSLFGLQAWIPSFSLSLNTPGWSVSVEMLFYLLFPFLFNKMYHTISLKKATVIVILFWIVTQILFNTLLHSSFYKDSPSGWHDLLFYFPLMHLSSFMAGNITGLYFINRPKVGNGKNGLIILLLIIVILSVLNSRLPAYINCHDGFLAILFVPLIYCLSSNNGITAKLFKLPLFVFLGEISYSIYILQKPIFKFGKEYIGCIGIVGEDTQFYCITLLLILISAISYLYIETPLRIKIKSIGSKSKYSLPVKKQLYEMEISND